MTDVPLAQQTTVYIAELEQLCQELYEAGQSILSKPLRIRAKAMLEQRTSAVRVQEG